MYRPHYLARFSLLCSSHVKLSCRPRRRLSTLPPTWSKQFKILFLGRDEFSCLVLQQLYAAQDVWQHISIATNPDEKVDRGSRLSVSPLKILAHSLNLPVHEIPHAKSDFKHWNPPSLFSELNDLPPPAEHLIVTASFGRILPLRMLKLFPENRRLNVHPSLLPAYRGAAPIQHTLLNGEKETGVCVIEMLKRARGIDTGAIWGCSKMTIRDGTMFHTLRDELAIEGGKLLVSVLRDMMDGKAVSTPQANEIDAPLAPMISFKDSTLDFTTMSADVISQRHHAIAHQRPLTAYLQTIKTLQMHDPYIHNSPPVFTPTVPGRACYSKPDKALLIRCANDSVLAVPKVKQEGKALLHARDWWSGAKSLGLVVNNEVNFDSQDDVDQWLQPELIA